MMFFYRIFKKSRVVLRKRKIRTKSETNGVKHEGDGEETNAKVPKIEGSAKANNNNNSAKGSANSSSNDTRKETKAGGSTSGKTADRKSVV